MLGDSEEAGTAVLGTFVNAATFIRRLSDPAQFRAWLFALARNQCLPDHQSPDVTTDDDIQGETERRLMGRTIEAFGSNGSSRTRQASGPWLSKPGWPKLAAGAASLRHQGT